MAKRILGLDIGSHTPPEIAISIMAEITSLRNRATQSTQNGINAA